MSDHSANAGAAEVSGDVAADAPVDPDVAALKRASSIDYLRRELEAADAGIDRAKAKVLKVQELVADAERSVTKMQADREVAAAALAAAEQEAS